ncbi:MAG: heavy-metal-associated domain-containing protein [Afipia felis]|uniref:heavy-metal-associated domain-containing protein n=1 Tax=Hyphomicrobiales TaxID=356 RepID=UPI000645851F|nr:MULTISPECIES: heavy metal-associated domain-containing protein [Hyphomicrobiales]MBN9604640.1 heavy-metal-associated domain-containing protein [Afipia felis]MCA3576377.1 heavy-metal-associated domain-containing protein [Bradyrhizobium sp.]MCA3797809.1 heavy-metal-associated domain-containing protein [Burkholderia sp.]RKD74835.1 copper chaperone [Rhizobium sp. WW_1]
MVRQDSSLATVTLAIPGMVCEGCAEKIRDALTAIPGIHKVKTKLWQKQIQVTFKKETVREQTVVQALGEQGFDAVAS